jgi:hypothetical protein
MKPNTADFLLGLICLVAGVVYYQVASVIPKSMLSDEIGPGGVPAAVGLAAVVVSILLMIKAAIGTIKDKRMSRTAADLPSTQASSESDDEASPVEGHRSHGLSILLALVLATLIFVLPIFGYLISIFLLILVSAALSGHAKNRSLVIFALSTSVTLYLVFHFVMGVKLPKGPLGF